MREPRTTPAKDEPGEPRCGNCGDIACCPRLEARIEVLEGHRRRYSRLAFDLMELVESLGAMDLHDANGHTGRYVCSWCDGEGIDVTKVAHQPDCRIDAMLDRFRETDKRTGDGQQ